jgi:FKBP-type peptidyl-prolyl cis-trans isomerase (trigger factor)
MKISLQLFISAAFIALSACSTQEIKQDTVAVQAPAIPAPAIPAIKDDSAQNSGLNPAMTLLKNNIKLNLVRVMDGGACKNELQGAKGTFLIYADSADIERIKREKGPKVFGEFENKIQAFASSALQDAINATNLNENPFSLGADETQEQLTKQLLNNFLNSVAKPIKQFRTETTLNIDVQPFPPSFMFYQHGCDATHLEPEN